MILMENRNIIGEKIRQIREKNQITQDQLAARINIQGAEVDRPMISRIESQTRYVLDYELKAISVALGVDIATLFEE